MEFFSSEFYLGLFYIENKNFFPSQGNTTLVNFDVNFGKILKGNKYLILTILQNLYNNFFIVFVIAE